MDNYRPNYIPKELIDILKHRPPLARLYLQPDSEQRHDSINAYTVKNGFRITEYINNPDILAVGCSQTWGVGVPDHALWPEVLAKKLSKSYFNLGVPGASIMHLVLLAIDYIETYGAPEYVVALWPDIRRMYTCVEEYVNTISLDSRNPDETNDKHEISLSDIHFPMPLDRPTQKQVKNLTPNISKRPYPLYEVNSYTMPFFYTVQYLEFFARYCQLKGIKMVFSSWDDDTIILFKELELKNFYFLDWLHYDKVQNEEIYINDCHLDMQDVYGINWCRGADHTKENRGHMGIHEHLDYAEMFERAIRDGQ